MLFHFPARPMYPCQRLLKASSDACYCQAAVLLVWYMLTHKICCCIVAPCMTTADKQNHTASLANVQPKGCLKELINATTGGDDALSAMITPECFNKLNLQLVNHTGAAGCNPRTFTGTPTGWLCRGR